MEPKVEMIVNYCVGSEKMKMSCIVIHYCRLYLEELRKTTKIS